MRTRWLVALAALAAARALLRPQPPRLSPRRPPARCAADDGGGGEVTDFEERLAFATLVYARIHGSAARVPEAFVAPASWPSALRGLPLGRELAARRAAAAAAARQREYDGLVAALAAYAEEHGDLVLPRHFRVPDREPYPAALRGGDLDVAVYDFAFYETYVAGNATRQAQLRDLGFVWQRLQPEYNLIFEALVAYQRIHGNALVPTGFVVPADWPPEIAGMPLGRRVRQIRSRNDFLGGDARKFADLESLGFVWDVDDYKRSLAHEACVRYALDDAHAALFPVDDARPPPPVPPGFDWASVSVPRAFVVPAVGAAAEKYPYRCRGLRLGEAVARRRRPVVAGARDAAFAALLAGLETYVALHGDADVPQKFAVPDAGGPWPNESRGLPLGNRVAAVRSRGTYLGGADRDARIAALDALGFVWAKRGPEKRRRRDPPG